MKTKRTILLTTTFAAIAILATFGIIRNFQKVEAFNPQPDPPGFGLVGITQGQTVRINVVNPALPDPNIPPDPIRATLNFRNADGELFRNANGNPISRTVLLQAGKSVSLDLNGDDFGRMADTTGRIQLRPVARIQQADGNGNIPPDPIIPSVEVFNNANGRTQFLVSSLPAVQRASTPQ
ncbi:MAG: hypothetical protein ACR2HG_10510 [Pyrinomonadaceae bacterium]